MADTVTTIGDKRVFENKYDRISRENQPSLSLLDPPAEIRNMIYKYYIDNNQGELNGWRHQAKYAKRKCGLLPLSQVCRQIYAETMPTFLRNTKFYFDCAREIRNFARSLGPTHLQHVKSIVLSECFMETLHFVHDNPFYDYSLLRWNLDVFTSLENITLYGSLTDSLLTLEFARKLILAYLKKLHLKIEVVPI